VEVRERGGITRGRNSLREVKRKKGEKFRLQGNLIADVVRRLSGRCCEGIGVCSGERGAFC